MAFLAYHGVSPAVFSEEIREHGMTWRQARRLEGELVELRKQDVDLRIKLAKLSAGLPFR